MSRTTRRSSCASSHRRSSGPLRSLVIIGTLALLAATVPPGAAQLPDPGGAIDAVNPTPEMGAQVTGVNATTTGGYTATADVLVWFECPDPAHYTEPYEVELRLEPPEGVEAIPGGERTLAPGFSETECKTGPDRHEHRFPITLELAPEVTAYTNLSIGYRLVPADDGPSTKGTLHAKVPLVGTYTITTDTTYREKDGRVPVYVSVHNTYNAPLAIEVSPMGQPNLGSVDIPGDRVLSPVQQSTSGQEDLFVLWYTIDERGLDSFSVRFRATILGPAGTPHGVLLEDVYEIRLHTEERWIHAAELEPIGQRYTPGLGAGGLIPGGLLTALACRVRRG